MSTHRKKNLALNARCCEPNACSSLLSWFLVLVSLFCANNVLAQTIFFSEIAAASNTSFTSSEHTISSIEIKIHGRGKTRPRVLATAIETKQGQALDTATLWRDVQRIKNFEVFQHVTATVGHHSDGVTIAVHVTDRWTLIPVFRPALGGGVFYLKLGVRDTNFLGANQDLAVYAGPYIAKAKKSYLIGVDWYFRQFLGRNRLESFMTRDFMIDPFYDYALGSTTSVLEVGIWSEQINFFWQGYDLIQPGASLLISKRDYRLLQGPAIAGLPRQSLGIRPGLLLRLGQVNYQNYQYTGADLLFDGHLELRSRGPDGFAGGSIEGRLFFLPQRRMNLAHRLRFDGRNPQHAVDQITYGGFDRIRGHPVNYLRGSYMGLSNNEVRIVIDNNILNLVFLQGVLLYDIALASDGSNLRLAQGAGVGIRGAIIPAYGMFVRADIAHSLNHKNLGFDIGIGIKEFY